MSTRKRIGKRKGRRPNQNGKKEIREFKKEIRSTVKAMKPNGKSSSNGRRLLGKGTVGRQISTGINKGVGFALRENESARNYPKVYMNPFLKMDARLPIWPVRQTLCQFRTATAFGLTNPSSKGWVIMNPINMICNDLSFAFTSLSTSADTAGDGGGTPVACGGAYTAASFDSAGGGYSCRLVAFGVKVRYTGTVFNKGGFATYYQASPRVSCNGLTSTIIQSQKIDWKQYDFDDNFHQYNRALTENDDGLYCNRDSEAFPDTPWQYDDFGVPNSENHDYMCVCIDSASPNQSFEVQFAGHFEIIGPVNNTTGLASVMPNTAKYEKVIGVQSKMRGQDTSTPDHTGENGFNWGKVAAELGVALMF